MSSLVRIIEHGAPGGQQSPADADTVVVVIDVIRAFTTAAIAGFRGARSIDCVADLDTAVAAAEQTPGAVLFAEDADRPEVTLGLGNAPSRAADAELGGRRAILCTTNGARVLAAAPVGALAAATVNLQATASWLVAHHADAPVDIWCTDPTGSEDRACANAVAALIDGRAVDVEPLRRAVEQAADEHLARWGAQVSAAVRDGFRSDARLCAGVDRWPIVLRSITSDGHTVRLIPEPPPSAHDLR